MNEGPEEILDGAFELLGDSTSFMGGEVESATQGQQRTPFSFTVIEEKVGPKVDPRIANLAKARARFSETKRARRESFEQVKQEVADSPDNLFNGNRTTVVKLSEKPEHRIMCYLAAQGKSQIEIAELLGVTKSTVAQVSAQPWFRKRLVEILDEAGRNKVFELLSSSALDSVYTLLDIRDSKESPASVRRSAADSLLDRFLGKATQRVETTVVKPPTTNEIASLDEEIASIDRAIRLEAEGSE